MNRPLSELLYRGELLNYPGPWAFLLPRPHIILVSDDELEALSNPDRKLNMSLTREPVMKSLRQLCEEAKARGARTLVFAYDHFFAQYRSGQHKPRRLTPDMDEYIARIARVSKFAQGYGLGLELSLLSPLEVGPAYRKATGESGVWMHYAEGLREPETGRFSVQLWRQLTWANNKGVVGLDDAGVRVFSFKESRIRGTPYRVVDPAGIIEIKSGWRVERMRGLVEKRGDYSSERIVVSGRGGDLRAKWNDRVLVVQQYRTPEMDYFSHRALAFLISLIDRYNAAGIKLNALYSDEMHIQQDWGYYTHHDCGQFAMRYVSPGLAAEYARKYGKDYSDFAKHLVYFAYGQEGFVNDLEAGLGTMHVLGNSPCDIRRTALFRSRYYRMLQDGVVDLFVAAKRHAEQRAGYRLESRAHATWAESPTCDYVNSGRENIFKFLYEYTSNFVWSNTVQQASAACADYFKWGEYLTGNGNDHAECGWSDRNYFGLALGCSTGIVNEVPYSYAAHWGMPDELGRRRQALVNTFGAAATSPFMAVQDAQHRDVDVLFLYPLDLVSVEERFGSWVTQYGYCNYITTAKLLEMGKVRDGAIEIEGRRFTTLVAIFEPFPSQALLKLMRKFSGNGGRLVWSGPAPMLSAEGDDILAEWLEIFGVDHSPDRNGGLLAAGQAVRFDGRLGGIDPQIILTDFIVDRIHPVVPRKGTSAVARWKELVVGSHRPYKGGGSATYLGFRPRDDQSASLGYETRTWFEILLRLGAYPGTSRFRGVNDNTEYVSRTTDYLACRFPNGVTAIAPHFRRTEEGWQGGFARDRVKDAEYLKINPPPDAYLRLKKFKVNGHIVDYVGKGAVSFRVDDSGNLAAFSGQDCNSITIDGRRTVFAASKVKEIGWTPVHPARRLKDGAIFQIWMVGGEKLQIPWKDMPSLVDVVAEGAAPGSRGVPVRSSVRRGVLAVNVPEAAGGRWMYVVARK